MSLRNKLLISFLSLVAIAVLIAGIGLSIISSFNKLFNDIMQNDVPILLSVSELKSLGIGLIESARGSVDLDESELSTELEEFSEREKDFRNLSNTVLNMPGYDPDLLESLHKAALELSSSVTEYLSLSLVTNSDEINLQVTEARFEEAETSFLSISDEIISELNAELTPEIESINSITQSLFVFGSIAGILLVIGAIVLGIYLSNTIIRPLQQLTFAVDQLREGKLNVQMEVESQDEIGQLAQSFNQMSSELRQTTVSRDYVENIIQAMGSILLVTNEKGIIQNSNPFSQQLLGYSEEELQGRDVAMLFESLESLELDSAATRTSIKPRNGKAIPVSLSRRRVEDSELVVYNAQDLTQIERMQQQLIEAQSEIEAQFKRSNRLYTMMDLMRRQLNNVFEHGASRDELREYMAVLNEEFEKLGQSIKESD